MYVACPTPGQTPCPSPGYQNFHPVSLSFGYDPSSFVIAYVISACLKSINSVFFIIREARFPFLRQMAFA